MCTLVAAKTATFAATVGSIKYAVLGRHVLSGEKAVIYLLIYSIACAITFFYLLPYCFMFFNKDVKCLP